MAIQLINVGNIANDGTGDDLREAMIKINQNFEEIDLRDDEKTTASNLGSVGQGIFSNRVNYDLQFKKIFGGDKITITADDEKITVAAQVGVEQINLSADTGSSTFDSIANIEVVGGAGISTEVDSSGNLIISNTYNAELSEDPTPELGGHLDGAGFNITNAGSISSTGFTGPLTGNVTGLVHGIDIRNINTYFDGTFEFGGITPTITNFMEWLASEIDIDVGTIAAPDIRTIDFGSL